jgi:hypothetical protein
MIKVPDNTTGHNDCIFVNKGYEKYIEKDKIIKVSKISSSTVSLQEIYDNYGLKCIINL